MTEVEKERAPAVLVHGTFIGTDDSFGPQRELDGPVRLVVFERRGYGSRAGAPDPVLGWPADAPDLQVLMERAGGAHLVGHSYGGVVVAAAASRRPDLVRSLVLVEPALSQAAADHPAIAARMDRERAVFARAHAMDAGAFTIEWMASMGAPPEAARAWIATWTERERAAAEVCRRERWYGDAPIDFARLAAIGARKVVVMGAGRPPTTSGADDAQDAVRIVCTALADRTGAELVRFESSTHFPNTEEPERFNALLRDVWGISPRG